MKARAAIRIACCAGAVGLALLAPPERARAEKPVVQQGTGPLQPSGQVVSLPLRSQVVENLIRKKTDGKFGYFLKEVGGPALLAHNVDSLFYPASTFKVLIHAYAMRQVQEGKIALSDSIEVAQENDRIERMTLETALTRMMLQSTNAEPNALIERWGKKALNDFAAELGLADTAFRNFYATEHCGLPYAKSNTLTLADAGRFYEAIWRRQILTRPTTQAFFQLMQHSPGAVKMIDRVIDEEALSLGLSATKKQEFRNRIFIIWKSGGSQANDVTCGSRAGLVSLPGREDKGVKPLVAVFGFFTERATLFVNDPNLNELVIGELLRKEIRARMAVF